MTFDDLYRRLDRDRYHVFSFDDVACLYPAARRASLKQLLHRWRRRGRISSLKRGLYELTWPRPRGVPDLYVANRLYAPSYVSLETALSHYGLIPEVAMAVTSVSVKATRRFRNSHGLFVYRTVRGDCFAGYRVEEIAGYSVLIAEPEKALADYLHFKTFGGGTVDVRAERLDAAAIGRLSRRKMDRYALPFGLDMKGMLYARL